MKIAPPEERRGALPWLAREIFGTFFTCLQARGQPAADQSSPITLIGAFVSTFGYGIVTWSIPTNAFFSMGIRIQTERNQSVVQDGPYRLVRHPDFLKAISFELATPFMLGMGRPLLPTLFNALILVFRIFPKDRILHDSLQGYTEYSKTVRYRLLPRIW